LSTSGNKCFFLFVDVHSREKWIRFGRNKSNLKREFKEWMAQIENETGKRPVHFMPDGGGEFDNKDLINYLKKKGVLFELTCTDCPNQNPFVERGNGLVQTHIKKLLAQAGLPNKYWEDAARFAVEVENALPVKTIDWKTPNEAWSGQTVDKTLQRVRVFGCEAWFVIPNAHRKKGSPKARKGIYLGTSTKHHGWKILDLHTRKVVNSRDVYFHENRFPFKEDRRERRPVVVGAENDDVLQLVSASSVAADDNDCDQSGCLGLPADDNFQHWGDHSLENEEDFEDRKHNDPDEEDVEDRQHDGPDVIVGSLQEDHSHLNLSNSSPVGMRTRRQRPDPTGQGGYRYTKEFLDSVGSSRKITRRQKTASAELEEKQPMVAEEPEVEVPDIEVSAGLLHVPAQSDVESEIVKVAVGLGDNVKDMHRRQIMQGSLKDEFIEAEDRELKCLKIHGTYRVVKRPTDRIPITCRWCYDVKRDADNNIILYKARLVAHGFKQVEGVDFTETFAATAQMKSFRATVALAQLLDLRYV
jgi:hypothetical protein